MVRYHSNVRKKEMENPSAPVPPADDDSQPPVTSSSEVPELEGEKPLVMDLPTGEAAPTQPSVVEQGEAGPSTTFPEDEVFRVNRLLQIENMDWSRQLKQAVCGFQIFMSRVGFPYFIPWLTI